MTLIRVWHLERAMNVLNGGPPCLFLYNEGHHTWVPSPPLSSHASFPKASSRQEGLELGAGQVPERAVGGSRDPKPHEGPDRLVVQSPESTPCSDCPPAKCILMLTRLPRDMMPERRERGWDDPMVTALWHPALNTGLLQMRVVYICSSQTVGRGTPGYDCELTGAQQNVF